MLTKQEDKILLQRVMGKTTSAIARDAGLTEAEVERIVADHTDTTLTIDIRKRSLALDLTRLDLLVHVCMSRAVEGDMQAVLAALKIIQRRCTMLGLHTPSRLGVACRTLSCSRMLRFRHSRRSLRLRSE